MEEKFERERSVQSLYLDEHGRELPNPTPMQPAVGYKKQPSIGDLMRQAIRQASLEAAQAGHETEAEANDFDVGEDVEPHSPWESEFEPDPMLDHMLALRSEPPRKASPTSATPTADNKPVSIPPAKPSEPSAG